MCMLYLFPARLFIFPFLTKDDYHSDKTSKTQAIRQVKQFSYLGSRLTSDGRCGTEIKRRIRVVKKAFHNLAYILTNRKSNLDTRKRIVNSCVWPVLLYSCGTDNQQEHGAEIKIFRIMVFQTYAKSMMIR